LGQKSPVRGGEKNSHYFKIDAPGKAIEGGYFRATTGKGRKGRQVIYTIIKHRFHEFYLSKQQVVFMLILTHKRQSDIFIPLKSKFLIEGNSGWTAIFQDGK
jgi:hypothetical protein